jgi:RES domain-containing protein
MLRPKALAARLTATGVAGIVLPSFASGTTAADINPVFWHWAPSPPHRVQGVDDFGRLPSDARSWLGSPRHQSEA